MSGGRDPPRLCVVIVQPSDLDNMIHRLRSHTSMRMRIDDV